MTARHTARSEQTPHANPATPSPSAAEQLSPAFPQRAAWGTAKPLRAWQAEALEKFRDLGSQDFLAVATPGAGKTTFALRAATDLLAQGVVRRVTVVCPTEHLKVQWAQAAERVGISLDPAFMNAQGRHGAHFDGVALTYAQVAANPRLHRARTEAEPTLVILDEIHHGGDALSWGDAVREAFEPARRRLALTGTPFRSDTAAIPFVDYVEDADGIRRSRADITYGYGQALADGVVRPVIFLAYSGLMRWRTRAGDEIAASLGEPLTKDMTAQALRTALDPAGEWIPAVLSAADARLSEVRRTVPDAGGLVISDDKGSSDRIEEFSASDDRWMVAVRMVSEGVDVPRLSVGVYATTTATPLYFAQAVGRFVRARRRGETASLFLPSVGPLLGLADELEKERDHALDRPIPAGEFIAEEDMLLAEANREEKASDELALPGFAALGSQATFDRVLFDGGHWGTEADVGSVEEQEYLGLPGLLEPEQVTTLLRDRQAKQVESRKRQAAAAKQRAANAGIDDHKRRAQARKELSTLVSAWARRAGSPHGVVHSDLRRICGGPEVATATTEQIEARIALVRKWFVGGR